MKGIFKHLSLLAIFFIPRIGFSQEVKAYTQIDSTEIKVGEQIRVVLKVEVDSAAKVKFPTINKFLSDRLEVLNVSAIQTQKVNSVKILSETLTITSFDSGNQNIPIFSFIVENADQSLDTIYSDSAFVKVYFPQVDTTAQIKDIKEPLDTPFERNELWSYLNYFLYLIILIVLVLIGIQYFKIHKPKPKPFIPAPVQMEPADTAALRALNALKQKRKWKSEEERKDFYEELSLIIRKYLQQRFKIPALERTSNEILEDLRGRALSSELNNCLRQIMGSSDLVKFAKYNPSEEENNICLENAFLFVNRTKAVETQKENNG